MAIKLYRNKTNVLQTVYDGDMQKFTIVPSGTVQLEEKIGAKYGCLQEVVAKKTNKADKAPDTGNAPAE